ncbi:MAG: hypothetical protein A3E07_02660 [Candidatus Wildermuthbacteria bacterium RIFCSPHIGHO2_12_FULL_45_9]|uniref:CAAX prenyl protease 2/Lysostaphin resistance protein A-like domain-containing protein n=1 Tax=Candidatus Wildermuthbacteria bacterium RIFCSPHIGHO2_02_FULL_45_25 TaxID=1802450 RepID=A0A1G2QX86_9BACT|nr:MAG: hypothetical protein A3C04_02670 [Candidatus Wildermuthbacteria bacterium RIFCSPHIGHO2_02_FULL_45_25]OHA70438.1 MAG: hypothetical protein A3E07_02660 [Candidatus Wildermuthbacteria bacterium RIFCSPHIGHO2_12_FULL_45_9]
MKRIFEYLAILLLCASTVVLVALQLHIYGWILWGIGMTSLLLCKREFSKNILLLYLSIAVFGFTPINTDISSFHIVTMGAALFLALGIPYSISRFIYKDHLVRFRFHHGRGWYKSEVMYIGLTLIVTYFLLPFYLQNTGAYANWNVDPGISMLSRLFIGTMGLGIWDELFFINTVFVIFQRFLRFFWANLFQGILFSSFLYELGFTGWGFVMIFFFALIQGWVFKKTDSLLYVITIHVALDAVLFLSLIHAHHPDWMPLFFM